MPHTAIFFLTVFLLTAFLLTAFLLTAILLTAFVPRPSLQDSARCQNLTASLPLSASTLPNVSPPIRPKFVLRRPAVE